MTTQSIFAVHSEGRHGRAKAATGPLTGGRRPESREQRAEGQSQSRERAASLRRCVPCGARRRPTVGRTIRQSRRMRPLWFLTLITRLSAGPKRASRGGRRLGCIRWRHGRWEQLRASRAAQACSRPTTWTKAVGGSSAGRNGPIVERRGRDETPSGTVATDARRPQPFEGHDGDERGRGRVGWAAASARVSEREGARRWETQKCKSTDVRGREGAGERGRGRGRPSRGRRAADQQRTQRGQRGHVKGLDLGNIGGTLGSLRGHRVRLRVGALSAITSRKKQKVRQGFAPAAAADKQQAGHALRTDRSSPSSSLCSAHSSAPASSLSLSPLSPTHHPPLPLSLPLPLTPPLPSLPYGREHSLQPSSSQPRYEDTLPRASASASHRPHGRAPLSSSLARHPCRPWR
jgi:hypothetical protein